MEDQMLLPIMVISIISMLSLCGYMLIADPLNKVAIGRCTCPCRDCQDCQYRNACQTDSKVTNLAALTTDNLESDTSRSSPSPNSCQDYSEVPKPPPMTDPDSILDYYWYYYCYYYTYHHPESHEFDNVLSNPPPMAAESFESYWSHSSPRLKTCQDPSQVPKPPPVTDKAIYWYYYYYYSYYRRHLPPEDCETVTDSEVTNSPSSTPDSGSPTFAPSSGSSACEPQPMNTGRPRAPILKSGRMTSSASRIPRPIRRYGLHCGSRNKKVAFGETQVIRG